MQLGPDEKIISIVEQLVHLADDILLIMTVNKKHLCLIHYDSTPNDLILNVSYVMFLMNGGDPYVLRDLLGDNTMATIILYFKRFAGDLKQKYEAKSPVDNLHCPKK